MIFKKAFFCIFCFTIFQSVFAQTKNSASASMGKINLQFTLDENGKPAYSVSFNQKPVILSSALGFSLNDDSLFYKDFVMTGTEEKTVDENWQPVWGELKNIRNHYKQIVVHLAQQKQRRRMLDIVFRVFEDGVGFRYEFPKQPGLQYFIVKDELTHFNLTGDHKAFWIPGDYDSNEYPYTTCNLSAIDNKPLVESSTAIAVRVAPDRYAVQTPLLLKTTEGLYINIHEAALVDYPAMQLHVDGATDQL